MRLWELYLYTIKRWLSPGRALRRWPSSVRHGCSMVGLRGRSAHVRPKPKRRDLSRQAVRRQSVRPSFPPRGGGCNRWPGRVIDVPHGLFYPRRILSISRHLSSFFSSSGMVAKNSTARS